MELSEIIQGGGLVLSGGVVMKLLDWARSAWTARNQRTEISPNPLPVEGEIAKKQSFVTVGECNRRMCEHDQRLAKLDTEIKRSNDSVIAKLDELDARSEERSIKTHQRLDPLIQQIGRLSGKVEIIENAAIKSTIGGKK